MKARSVLCNPLVDEVCPDAEAWPLHDAAKDAPMATAKMGKRGCGGVGPGANRAVREDALDRPLVARVVEVGITGRAFGRLPREILDGVIAIAGLKPGDGVAAEGAIAIVDERRFGHRRCRPRSAAKDPVRDTLARGILRFT